VSAKIGTDINGGQVSGGVVEKITDSRCLQEGEDINGEQVAGREGE
jgi:hypothetical protein